MLTATRCFYPNGQKVPGACLLLGGTSTSLNARPEWSPGHPYLVPSSWGANLLSVCPLPHLRRLILGCCCHKPQRSLPGALFRHRVEVVYRILLF